MTLRRDANRVRSCLKELANGQLLCTEACRIQIPTRYADINIAQIGIETHVYGIFALILSDGSYSVTKINAMVHLMPRRTTTVTIENRDYYEFSFEANDVIVASTSLVKRDAMMYNILDEFFFQGKVPWYVNYNDLGTIFDSAKYHAGSNIADSYASIELIASLVSRSEHDLTKYYRSTIADKPDDQLPEPAYNSLNDVFYSATNTLNKLAGSYFKDGVISALVTKTQTVSHLERLLRA